MHRWLWGLVVLIAWVVGALSQDGALEPLTIVGPSSSALCEWVLLMFKGGVKPYSLYFAVILAGGTNTTLSNEEFWLTTEDSDYGLFVDYYIAGDTIRFRIQDSAGEEAIILTQVTEQVLTTCEAGGYSSAVSIDLTTYPNDDSTITTKAAIEMISGLVTSGTVAAGATRTSSTVQGSERPVTSRPQAGGTVDQPPQETGTNDTRDPTQTTSPRPDGTTEGGGNGAPEGSEVPGLPNRNGVNQESGTVDNHEPTINNSTGSTGNSQSRRIQLSSQAAGIIGATVGIVLLSLIGFAWYRRR
ncbi:hypothetical protein CPB86DRAFT_536626 [Serendipita vermifera]|nr:hypothetical protein CPB86DRAFT_536626 [Serendipita vermifera]